MKRGIEKKSEWDGRIDGEEGREEGRRKEAEREKRKRRAGNKREIIGKMWQSRPTFSP